MEMDNRTRMAWQLLEHLSLRQAACLALDVNPDTHKNIAGYKPLIAAMQIAVAKNELKSSLNDKEGNNKMKEFILFLDNNEWAINWPLDEKGFRYQDDCWRSVSVKKDDFMTWLKFRDIESDFFTMSEDRQGKISISNKEEEVPYSTPLLKLLNNAALELWQDVDPDDKKAPTNELVMAWLTDTAKERNINLSNNLKKIMPTIIRHPDKPK